MQQSRWVRLIFTVATGSRKFRLFLAPVVGLSYFTFAVLFVLGAFLLDGWLHFPRLPAGPINWFVSVPLIIAGLALAGWCVISFIRVKGTPVPFNPPPVLITTGPYARVRNPMLSGVFLFLFGLGFAFQSLSLLLIFTPLFILINVLELKMIEEPELEMRLGEDYLKYKKRTPMFFPKIGPGVRQKIEKGRNGL